MSAPQTTATTTTTTAATPAATVADEVILLGTGTSEGVPKIPCLVAIARGDPDLKPCACHDVHADPSSTNPNRRRNTSALLRVTPPGSNKRLNILIDCGKQFYAAAKAHFPALGVDTLDGIILTHPHADAIFGLDDLRAFATHDSRGVATPIPVWTDPGTMDVLKNIYPYLVDAKVSTGGGGVASLSFHTFTVPPNNAPGPGLPFQVAGVTIYPFSMPHGAGPCTGFRIGDLAYCSDVSAMPASCLAMINGASTVILDAVNWDHPHPSHLNLNQGVKEIIPALSIQPKNVWFIGFTHSMPHESTSARLAELTKDSPINYGISYDGLKLAIPLTTPPKGIPTAGKHVLMVTGASRGFGAWLTVISAVNLFKWAPAASSLHIIITARTESGLQSTASAIKEAIDNLPQAPSVSVSSVAADLSSGENAAALASHPDVISALQGAVGFMLVQNAANLGRVAPLASLTAKDMDEAWSFNITSPFALATALTARLEPHVQATMINVTSLVGKVAFEGLSIYGIGKAAREAMMLSFAQEGRWNIFSYSPGVMDTAMTVSIRQDLHEAPAKLVDGFRKSHADYAAPKQAADTPDPEFKVRGMVHPSVSASTCSRLIAGLLTAAYPESGGREDFYGVVKPEDEALSAQLRAKVKSLA